MAIKKYTPSSVVYNGATIKTWLDENKQGTFLENATITSGTWGTNNAGSRLDITLGDDTFTFTFWGTSYTRSYVDRAISYFNSQLTLYCGYVGPSYTYAFPDGINMMFLCKHGLLIRIYGGYTTSSSVTNFSWAVLLLTVDNTGRFTVVYPYQDPAFGYMNNAHNSEIKGHRVLSGNTVKMPVNLVPVSNVYSTALQQFSAYSETDGTGYYTPFAYYATATQFTPNNCTTIGVVELDNIRYITNGRWYIRDDD